MSPGMTHQPEKNVRERSNTTKLHAGVECRVRNKICTYVRGLGNQYCPSVNG